jgi:predicted transcriptional regulator of viral defense system
VIDELLTTQHGILTRAQAHAAGITDEMIEANIAARRWTRRYAGVYATFSGQLPRPADLWAAVLKVGSGAVLSHETAAELVGLVRPPSAMIHVTVPAGRTVRPIAGVVLHRSRRVQERRHPALAPPQTRVEETLLDLTQSARSLDDAIAWLARGVGARVTTPPRLGAAIERRHRVRWREQLREAVSDVAAGCHSILELRYLARLSGPMACRRRSVKCGRDATAAP